MNDQEIIEAELKSVEEHKAEVKEKLEELTQHLGRMNVLHNIFTETLKDMGSRRAHVEIKDSSES